MGRPGKRGHHDRDAEVLVALAELVDGGAFVGIGHEVDVALHDVGIELERVLDDGAVLGVVLVAQHDHEGRVVDAMHAEGADEVTLHEPEGLGEEQGAGHFGGDAIDDLAPELVRHGAIELGLRSCRIRRGRGWRRSSRDRETRGDESGAWRASWRRRSE